MDIIPSVDKKTFKKKKEVIFNVAALKEVMEKETLNPWEPIWHLLVDDMVEEIRKINDKKRKKVEK